MCICKQCAPFKFHREAGHALITYMYWHFWDWSWQCSSDGNFERLSGQLLATLATRQSLFGLCLRKNLWLHVGVDNEFVCSVLTGCMLMASCQVPNLDAQENDIYQMQNCKNVIVSGCKKRHVQSLVNYQMLQSVIRIALSQSAPLNNVSHVSAECIYLH